MLMGKQTVAAINSLPEEKFDNVEAMIEEIILTGKDGHAVTSCKRW